MGRSRLLRALIAVVAPAALAAALPAAAAGRVVTNGGDSNLTAQVVWGTSDETGGHHGSATVVGTITIHEGWQDDCSQAGGTTGYTENVPLSIELVATGPESGLISRNRWSFHENSR